MIHNMQVCNDGALVPCLGIGASHNTIANNEARAAPRAVPAYRWISLLFALHLTQLHAPSLQHIAFNEHATVSTMPEHEGGGRGHFCLDYD